MIQLSVLLVEDHPANRELVLDLLESEGHHVTIASDGAMFRRVIAQGAKFDVVLMDIRLPDGDGLSLLGELRADTANQHTAVVAITAHALTGDRDRLLGAGFDDVLTKPIDTRTIVADIERFARRAPRRTSQETKR